MEEALPSEATVILEEPHPGMEEALMEEALPGEAAMEEAPPGKTAGLCAACSPCAATGDLHG